MNFLDLIRVAGERPAGGSPDVADFEGAMTNQFPLKEGRGDEAYVVEK